MQGLSRLSMIEGTYVHGMLSPFFISFMYNYNYLMETIDHLFFSCPVAKAFCRLLISLKGKDFLDYEIVWSGTDVHVMLHILTYIILTQD